jgi:hypothetical protein
VAGGDTVSLSFWLRWFSATRGEEEEKEGEKRAAAERREMLGFAGAPVGE